MRKRVFGIITLLCIFVNFVPNVMAYTQRTHSPNGVTPYYYSNENPFYAAGLVGECTWYAWGRAYELLGSKPYLPTSGAGQWYNSTTAYAKSTNYYTAKVGAIACYSGHVAVVEAVGDNGAPSAISEGGFGSSYIAGQTIETINGRSDRWFHYGKDYTSGFQGYIYLNINDTPPSAPKNCQVGSWDARVQIQWETVSGAIGYECGLIDANTRNTVFTANTTDWYYNFYNVPEGSYFAYAAAYNSAGYSTHSNWARVDVQYSIPPKPSITSNGANIRKNASPYISWNATDNTMLYMYYLSEYPNGYAYSTNTECGDTTGTSVTFSNLTSGYYAVFVQAVSPLYKWSDQSNWVYFRLYEEDYLPTKTLVKDNHIYALYDYEMSWTFAKELCEDFGGHLVTITSAEEENLIENLIGSGSKAAYWLGATDITDFGKLEYTEKEHKWITGEDFSYSNWASGEPNADGENGTKEHFAEIRKSYSNKWNDVNNISKSNKGFILEIEVDNYSPVYTEEYDGHTYIAFDKNTTWSEAKVFCEQLGGHLATIESSAENEFVQSLLKNGGRAWYYIGGQKEDGVWKWVDGNTATAMTLSNNAFSFAGKNLMMYRSTGTCVGLDNTYYPASDMKNIGFVCEIDSVHETPTFIPGVTLPLTVTTADEGKNAMVVNDSDTDYSSVVVVVNMENGAVEGITTDTEFTVKAGESRSIALKDGENKIFLWDSLDTMIPLARAYTLMR